MTEQGNTTVFEGSNANPVMKMLKYIPENYEGDERTFIDEDGDEVDKSYRILILAHNSSGFDSWVVLNYLVKEMTELKIIKTARGLLSLSFFFGFEIVKTVEVPHYKKINMYKISYKKIFRKNR